MSGSSPFSASVTGFRQVRTRVGDTLQEIALRELADASKWHLLADLNGLVDPYIVSSLSEITGSGVILAGQPIMIPATAPAPSGVSSTDDVFGIDLLLQQGKITASASGDFQTISGPANLTQALNNRLGTKPKELIFHPEYGCEVYELLGQGATPGDGGLAQVMVSKCIKSDPRVSSTSNVTATISGDSIAVNATAVAVTGQQVPTGIPGGVISPISGGTT